MYKKIYLDYKAKTKNTYVSANLTNHDAYP